MSAKPTDKKAPANSKDKSANVTVFHVGPHDQDLHVLAEILDRTDWKLCPGTHWTISSADDIASAAARVKDEKVPIVLCERESGNWKEMLDSVRKSPAPPMLIVTSRTADEYLWAEALNLGAYDVLSKPYHPAEVVRVLSMAWLHWTNRRTQRTALAQAS